MSGAIAVDVLVVGAGIQGCAVARELARRGRTVVVVDPEEPGAESSGAAAGILGPNLDAHAEGAFLSACLESAAMWPELADALEEESSVFIEYESCGAGKVALNAQSEAEWRGAVAGMRARGQRARWLNAEELREVEPTLQPTARGALYVDDEARLDPVLLMRALPIAARQAGARFVQAAVVEIQPLASAQWGPGEGLGNAWLGAPRLKVVTDAEEWLVRNVVLAAGAWSSTLPGVPLARPTVRPARGQAVLLKPSTSLCQTIWFSHRGYVVPRNDGTLYCGSTVEFKGYDRRTTAGGIRDILDATIELLPDAASAPFQEAWAGLRPHTDDLLPILGPGKVPGLWYQCGHFRTGILLAPLSATVVAQLICGERPLFDVAPFTPSRLGA